LRRASATDSAIELGIALEALLLNDLDRDRGELTFRLRLRGARFLGATPSETREIFKSLRLAYDLRSRAVHSGNTPEELDGVPSSKILETGYGLTVAAVEKIIRLGKSPDWTDVVLD
jgi:hypothetical protein